MAEVIFLVKAVDYDYFTGGGCVNEALVVQIYSNMPGSLAHPEEYEITRQRLIDIERVRGAQLFSSSPRHQDARFTVGIEHETATGSIVGLGTACADASSSSPRLCD